MTPDKKGVFIRLSDDGRSQLEELRERFGETQEGVIRMALDRLYRDISMIDDLKEIFKKGVLVNGRTTIIELGQDQETPQKGSTHDRPEQD